MSSASNILDSAGAVGVCNMTRIQHRNGKYDAAENAIASSGKSCTPAPAFEFCVRSEDGINLIVDLDSSLSDWPMRLENEVFTCQNLQKNKFQSFCQELEYLGNGKKDIESSLLWNTDSDKNLNNGHVHTDSLLNLITNENDHVGCGQPQREDWSLGLLPAKSCSGSAEMSAHLEEGKDVAVLSRFSSDVPNQMVRDTKSCPTDEENKTADSNVFGAIQVKLARDSVHNLTSASKGLNLLEDQNSKLHSANCGNISVQSACSLEKPSVQYPGCSVTGSVEMQRSGEGSPMKDPSCSPSLDNCSLNLVDKVYNVEAGDGGLVISTEINHDACVNFTPTSSEKWKIVTSCCLQERGSPISRTETSDSTLEKRSEDLISDGGHKRRHKGESDMLYGD
ncbi:unnamed protein product, partial [Ilex paraguariensis]